MYTNDLIKNFAEFIKNNLGDVEQQKGDYFSIFGRPTERQVSIVGVCSYKHLDLMSMVGESFVMDEQDRQFGVSYPNINQMLAIGFVYHRESDEIGLAFTLDADGTMKRHDTRGYIHSMQVMAGLE